MVDRRRPDQKDADVREEVSHQVKQDPRRERSGPLWLAAIQQLQIDLAALQRRVTDLEEQLATERALHGAPPLGDGVPQERASDPSQRPTVQVRVPLPSITEPKK